MRTRRESTRTAGSSPRSMYYVDSGVMPSGWLGAVKLLYVVDEFTREALAMEAERRIDGDQVVDVLDRIVAEQSRQPAVRPL